MQEPQKRRARMQGGEGGVGVGEREGESRCRPAVCRRLFDAEPSEAERDNMFNAIADEINKDLDNATIKYNFDFRRELPMEGKWRWERVSCDEPLAPEQEPTPQPAQQPHGQNPSSSIEK